MNPPHDTPEPGRPAHRARAALRAAGFTLIELLTVVAVMAILAALATPSMARLVDSSRLTSASNGFLAAMYHARSEAIKRNGPVALCKSATGLVCAVTGGWEQGWIVFHDTNNNGTADAGELVVRYNQALPDGFKLSGNQNVAGYISFTESGRTRLVSGAFQAGTLTLCKASGTEIGARQIVINNAGRARVEKLSINSCV